MFRLKFIIDNSANASTITLALTQILNPVEEAMMKLNLRLRIVFLLLLASSLLVAGAAAQ